MRQGLCVAFAYLLQSRPFAWPRPFLRLQHRLTDSALLLLLAVSGLEDSQRRICIWRLAVGAEEKKKDAASGWEGSSQGALIERSWNTAWLMRQGKALPGDEAQRTAVAHASRPSTVWSHCSVPLLAGARLFDSFLLQDIEPFDTPRVELEQYPTGVHVAARMLYTVSVDRSRVCDASFRMWTRDADVVSV